MADTKAEQKQADQKAPTTSQAGLRPAGEASDPQVHQLLAEMETARINGDKDARDAAVKKLTDLGYSAE